MNTVLCGKFVSCCLLLAGVFMIGSGVALAQESPTTVLQIDGGAAPSPSASDSRQANINTPPPAGSNRPANIPFGYVITPFGYFHPSCVQSLAQGEELLADGRLQHADGTVEKNAAACHFPRYTHTGLPVIKGAAKMSAPQGNGMEANVLPEASGWIENANTALGSSRRSYGALTTTWIVPAHPAADDGQVLYFFPGLEDINDAQTSILQPVLQWYLGQWAIASWNCCLSNVASSSPVVNVSPGDTIHGSITMNCRAGTLSCPTWKVVSSDLSTGKSTMLRNTPSDGQIFDWAFGGVLEPYYVIACDDYPPNQQITFSNVTVFDEHLRRIANLEWVGGFNSTVTPQCNYGVKAATHTVTISY